jgi:hypothetical protein
LSVTLDSGSDSFRKWIQPQDSCGIYNHTLLLSRSVSWPDNSSRSGDQFPLGFVGPQYVILMLWCGESVSIAQNALELNIYNPGVTAAASTLRLSDRDPSIHHIQTPIPTLAYLSFTQRIGSLFAAVSSFSIIGNPLNPGPESARWWSGQFRLVILYIESPLE